MRAITALVTCILLPATAFSLSCPNNGNILNSGDSIEAAIKTCGEPISKNAYLKSTIVSSEWTYYKTNPTDNTNTKLVILFNNNAISNISIQLSAHNEENVKSSGICGVGIQTGNTMQFVKTACGNPASEKPIKSVDVQITELKYDSNNINTLIFEDGKLANWK